MKRAILSYLGFVLVVFLAPATGAFSSPGDWYAGLQKPSWNPPSWIFGPVWTMLYFLIATSGWLIWRQGRFAANRVVFACFLAQLILNAAWTPTFFGMHAIGPALVVIVCMWCAILATVVAAWRKHRMAALLLLPYLAWVSFAMALNFTLWRLN